MPYKDKNKQREYQRLRVAKRRSDWFQENGPCKECNSWENLELDHIDPTQKESHRIWSWSLERMNTELAKCQVLCYDCHKAKTREQVDLTQIVFRGEEHGGTSLSNQDVIEIRERYATENITHQKLADEYGVGRSTVTELINKTWWKSI